MEIPNLHLAYLKDNRERWGLTWAFVQTLKKLCSNLCSLNITGTLMTPEDASYIFTVISEKCGNNLRKLNIVDTTFVKLNPQRRDGIRHAKLDTLLSRLTGLRELSMNFEWITPKLLTRLGQNCLCLAILTLEFRPNPRKYSRLTIANWEQLLKDLPDIEVKVVVPDFSAAQSRAVLETLRPHLPPGVLKPDLPATTERRRAPQGVS